MTAVVESSRPDSPPEFDPFSPEFLNDPYPFFASYREHQPIYFSPALDYWVLVRYEDVRVAFRDTATYSATNALSPIQPPCPHAAAMLRDGGFRSAPTLTNTDPPVHTRARRIANAAFTPRLVAQLDIPRVKEGSSNRLLFMFGRADEEQQVQIAVGMAAFWRYTEELVADRRERPRDDFTSELVRTLDAEGQPLSQQEAATVLFGLLLAGHETTTDLLTSGLRRFLEHGSAWEQICADPGLLPNAVEEVLRFDSSVVIWRRKTKVATRIRDVEVPADANLLLLIGSANRDRAVFADPNAFDIGNHLCLGAPLARLEARVVFEELTRRRPSLRLVLGQTFTFHPNISFRGPASLQVEWDVGSMDG
ncbi:MAG: cytochrome P450 [Dehalococcoidia bacterium]